MKLTGLEKKPSKVFEVERLSVSLGAFWLKWGLAREPNI